MSKKILTNQEISNLLQNPNVRSCTSKYITYSPKFKIRSVREYESGKSTYQIFIDAGISDEIVDRRKMKDSVRRWKKISDTEGLSSLKKTKKWKCGRKKKEVLTDKEKIKRLELENELLKAEKDFLVKLRAQKGWD